ncbi:MAG: SDR family oxidoreductase [Rhodobacter sp.]|nr:SDR family oxidoreductase [Rhodobacter sp.]
MNLIIFGATGTIGRHLTAQAAAKGHTVTAFARNPRDLPAGVTAAKGDVLNPSDVKAAMQGQDAIIVVLGNGMKGGLRAPGTANIVAGMRAQGINRLICQSTLGAGDSRQNLNFFWKYLMFGLLLRRAYKDHQRQEVIIRASGLDWTIVRPGAFTDGPLTGAYRAGFGPTDRSVKLKISRADVAHYLLRVLGDAASIGRTPGLSY